MTMTRMTRRVPSVVGREDYLRVRFDGAGGPHESRIEPLHGGSAIVSTVTRADGLVVVPAPAQGLAEGDEAEVLLYH